jgi:hypothetical protein
MKTLLITLLILPASIAFMGAFLWAGHWVARFIGWLFKLDKGNDK